MKKFASLFLIIFSFASTTLMGQGPSGMVYEGILSNIEGEILTETSISVTFKIEKSGREVLFDKLLEKKTNEYGKFFVRAATIPDADLSEGKLSIEIVLHPEENDIWMEEKDFKLKYYLEMPEEDEYSMTRFEGQKLTSASTKPVWVFSDSYPFGYLSSTFMVSFSKEITNPEEIILISNKLRPQVEENESPANRGLKGSPAVGGYKKR